MAAAGGSDTKPVAVVSTRSFDGYFVVYLLRGRVSAVSLAISRSGGTRCGGTSAMRVVVPSVVLTTYIRLPPGPPLGLGLRLRRHPLERGVDACTAAAVLLLDTAGPARRDGALVDVAGVVVASSRPRAGAPRATGSGPGTRDLCGMSGLAPREPGKVGATGLAPCTDLSQVVSSPRYGTICDGQGCQVYSCGAQPSAIHIQAVQETAGRRPGPMRAAAVRRRGAARARARAAPRASAATVGVRPALRPPASPASPATRAARRAVRRARTAVTAAVVGAPRASRCGC